MKHHDIAVIAGLGLALAAAWHAEPAFAAPGCEFSAPGTGARGNTAALIAAGQVEVSTPAMYATKFIVEVGVWVDADLAALDPNIPAVALSYYEHANCIFAHGRNATTGLGVHDMSLRIAGNRIRFFRPTSPKVPGKNAYWVQRTHQDWEKAIKALGPAAPKVNLMFTASTFVDIGSVSPGGAVTWVDNGGASNGVGQGQALARVDPTAYKNGPKAFNLDWWGVIAAHELGHALGFGNHLAVKFDNMCCLPAAPYTTEPGNTASYRFSMSQASWSALLANDAATTDGHADPYAVTPNPITNERWSFSQVHRFLVPSSTQGLLLRHTGAPCSAAGCLDWQVLDNNAATIAIAASEDRLYQLHGNGTIWRYTGLPCTSSGCDGWQQLDNNPGAKAIAAGGASVYQLRGDGSLWHYAGTPCASSGCTWQKLDHNSRTVAIAAAGGELYQRHGDGAIWRYTGTPCSGAGCPGWQKLDHNPGTKSIVAAAGALYQLHSDGAIWRYTGTPCSSAGCPGWQKLDQNTRTAEIAAGSSLYQRHSDGSIWRYTGTPCGGAGCPGWQKLDHNARTAGIAAAGNELYQRHSDGAVWRYTGTPCGAAGCPGWQKLDHDTRTRTISAGSSLYQLRGP